MKLGTFSVSSKAGEVLNWSMGLYLAFSGLSLIDNWTSAPNEGQGVITQAFATFQSSSMIQVIEAVALLATKLTMMEVFRRCLSRNKHFTAQLAVIVVMVLTFLIAAASNLPMFLCTPEEMSSGISGPALSKFSMFSIYCGLVLFVTNLILCIQLMVKYAGRIRLYGASLIGCDVAISLANMVYGYIYNNVGGVTMDQITTYGTIVSILSFVLGLVPYCLLRRTMVAAD